MIEQTVATGRHVVGVLDRRAPHLHKGVVVDDPSAPDGSGGRVTVDCSCGQRYSRPAGDLTVIVSMPLPERFGGPCYDYGDPQYTLCTQKWCQRCVWRRAQFSIEHPASGEQMWFCSDHDRDDRMRSMIVWLERLLADYGSWDAWRQEIHAS